MNITPTTQCKPNILRTLSYILCYTMVYLFNDSLFGNAASNSDYMRSNTRKIVNTEECGGKWSGPNRHYPCVCADGKDKTTWNSNFEAFHTVHACSQSLLFLPTKYTYYYNTYIYHQLLPTCFGICYTIFRENIALLAQKLYAFCNVAIKYTIYTVFFKFTMLLQCLKHYVFHPSLSSKSKNVS